MSNIPLDLVSAFSDAVWDDATREDVEKFLRDLALWLDARKRPSSTGSADDQPAPVAPAIDREGLDIRLAVARAVFDAWPGDETERANRIYRAALTAVGYDKSWAARSVSSFIDHLTARGAR